MTTTTHRGQVTITLPTALVPTHYSIMHGMYEDEQVPRSWQLKGSNDVGSPLSDPVSSLSLSLALSPPLCLAFVAA